jgi:hypothetical protein
MFPFPFAGPIACLFYRLARQDASHRPARAHPLPGSIAVGIGNPDD